MRAREELGLPRDEDEEPSDVERARHAFGGPSEEDDKLDWAFSDSEYAEDRAAWEELGLQA